jgi:hypothetical protein
MSTLILFPQELKSVRGINLFLKVEEQVDFLLTLLLFTSRTLSLCLLVNCL